MEPTGLCTGVTAISTFKPAALPLRANLGVRTKENGTIRNPYEQRLVPLQCESVIQSGVQETLPHHDYPEAGFGGPSQYEFQQTI